MVITYSLPIRTLHLYKADLSWTYTGLDPIDQYILTISYDYRASRDGLLE
jgi:hypothetical protein